MRIFLEKRLYIFWKIKLLRFIIFAKKEFFTFVDSVSFVWFGILDKDWKTWIDILYAFLSPFSLYDPIFLIHQYQGQIIAGHLKGVNFLDVQPRFFLCFIPRHVFVNLMAGGGIADCILPFYASWGGRSVADLIFLVFSLTAAAAPCKA